MRNNLTVCIDSNVFISAIAFGGKPLEVLRRALRRDFYLVTGPNIINDTENTLINKVGLSKKIVEPVLNSFLEISTIIVPTGSIKYIDHKKDNLILEIALTSKCDILVTGDNKHLIPLSPFKGLIIEPPSKFLNRIDKQV